MKKAIITGPTGAIGIALIQMLMEHDVEVTAVCHCGSSRISRIPVSDKVRIVECDLDQIRILPEILEHDYEVCYHFAWACTIGDSRNNIDAQLKNIQYTIDVVEVVKALGCRRFIGAGSQAEYGRYEGVLNNETPAFPENGYGIAKLCAGQLSRIRCEQLGVDHIWTRILSVYGPCDGENTLVMSMIAQLLKGERPLCTKGEQIWDYIYSKDAANAFYLLANQGKSGKIYCIGSGKGVPLAEYIKAIRDYVDPAQEIGFGEVPYGEKQVMYLCADTDDLMKDTGFHPSYSFEQGIKETIAWVRQMGEKN